MNSGRKTKKMPAGIEKHDVRSRPRQFRPVLERNFRPASFPRARREKTTPWFPLCLLIALAGLDSRPASAGEAAPHASPVAPEGTPPGPAGTAADFLPVNDLLAHGRSPEKIFGFPSTVAPAPIPGCPGWFFIPVSLCPVMPGHQTELRVHAPALA